MPAQFLLQLLQQPQDLRLHRHIEAVVGSSAISSSGSTSAPWRYHPLSQAPES